MTIGIPHGPEIPSEDAATIYTLIERSKLNNIDPFAHLGNVLEKLPIRLPKH